MLLQHFQSLLDQVPHVVLLALGVVYLVTHVLVSVSQQIEHGQYLPVVWNERLSYSFMRTYKQLDLLKSLHNGLFSLGLEGTFDRQDQLRQHWENLLTSLLE